MRIAFAITVCSLALGACGKSEAPRERGLEVVVGALQLPNTESVEYALAVFNAAPTGAFDVAGNVVGADRDNLVWENASVTSTRYGNGPGGGVTYVGTCDASVAENWVSLVLKTVSVGDGNGSYSGSGVTAGTNNLLDDQNSAATSAPGSNDGDADFENPCDYLTPCTVKTRCRENEDTLVTFDLTIMRDAEQGMFDIIVDTDDIFCSMKVDTCYDGSRQIELLFDDEGNRVPTAVIAAACSAGVDETATVLWMSPVKVTCDGGVSFQIDPTGEGQPGNASTDVQIPGAVTAPGAIASGSVTFQVVQGPAGAAIIDIPAGTRIARSDTGFDFVTTAAAVLDAQTFEATVTVAAQGVEAGAAYNGATEFAPIQLVGRNGSIYRLTVGGQGFAGGVDPTYLPGGHREATYSLTWGKEELMCGNQSCNKAYWTIAINLDDLDGLTNCTIETAITASESPALDQFVNGQLEGPGKFYPFVAFDAPLTLDDGPSCITGPLGSEFATTRYGASDDVFGADPFPHLCYFYERGAAAPQSLGNVPGYFSDADATPESALYAGRVTATQALDVAFDGMGGDTTGPCRSRVLDVSAARTFDGTAGLETIAWSGSGGTGAYRIEVYTKRGAQWLPRGGYVIDLRTTEGRAFFAHGGTFAAHGDDEVALVLTRLDVPFAAVDDLTIQVEAGQ